MIRAVAESNLKKKSRIGSSDAKNRRNLRSRSRNRNFRNSPDDGTAEQLRVSITK